MDNEEYNLLLKNYASSSKSLASDIDHVSGNVQELAFRKKQILEKINAITHEDAQRFYQDAIAAANELEKHLQLEERYFELIKNKWNTFKKDTVYLKKSITDWSFRDRDYSGKFKLQAHFDLILEINKKIDNIFNIMDTNRKSEVKHARSSKGGGWFAGDFAKHFSSEIERFSKPKIPEATLINLIESVKTDASKLDLSGKKFLDTWEKEKLEMVKDDMDMRGLIDASTVIKATANVCVASLAVGAINEYRRK